MNLARTVAALAIVLAGCTETVGGAGTAIETEAGQPSGSDAAALAHIMPTLQEAMSLTATRLTAGDPTVMAGTGELFEDLHDGAYAEPAECASVALMFQRQIYAGSGVRASTRMRYFHQPDRNGVVVALVGVAKFVSAESARKLFDGFAGRWPDCAGSTVTYHSDLPSKKIEYSTVGDVAHDGAVLSTTLSYWFSMWDEDILPAHNVERAVGIGPDVVVDVAVVDGEKGHPDAPPGTRAIDLVKLTLRKANGV